MSMTVSAHEVASVLRALLPDLPVKKLHKLLYYCQGHHLASFDRPLFAERVSAWDMGPVVGRLWHDERQGSIAPVAVAEADVKLGESELNTIGYVLSRYGALTGQDLELLSHSESPWRIADQVRQPGGSSPISLDSMRHYFRTDGAPDAGSVPLDSAMVREWLSDAADRHELPAELDSLDELRARLSHSV